MPRHGWRQRVWFYSPPVEGCPSGAGWLLLGFGFLGLAFGTGGLASPPSVRLCCRPPPVEGNNSGDAVSRATAGRSDWACWVYFALATPAPFEL